MAKLENTRKKYKDYRKEYDDAIQKVEAIKVRIRKRALDLTTRYPHVVIEEHGNLKYDAKDYNRMIGANLYTDVETFLQVIKLIEDYIASQHPHQQGKLFGDKFLSSNPSNPDAHL